MCKTVAAQEPGGEKLVMSGKQRRWIVQHLHVAGRESSESPQAVVDSVECEQYVKAPERAVPRAKDFKRLVWGQEFPGASDQRVREGFIRRSRAICDECELHAVSVATQSAEGQAPSPDRHFADTGQWH